MGNNNIVKKQHVTLLTLFHKKELQQMLFVSFLIIEFHLIVLVELVPLLKISYY